MPASCVIRTKSNVEDYFRMNSPLVVLKKIGKSPAEVANALAVYGYLGATKWHGDAITSNIAVYGQMATLIVMGYIPVFLGVTRSFHTAASTSADSATYEHIIAGQDLQTFMHNRFDFDQVNFEMIGEEDDAIKNNSYIEKANIIPHNPYSSTSIVKRKYVPRQKFTNATVAYLLDKNIQYSEEFVRRERTGSVRCSPKPRQCE